VTAAVVRHRRARRWRETGWAALLLSPSLVILGAFVLYPLFKTVRRGLYQTNLRGEEGRWVGLDQYRDAFTSSEFRDAVWVTLKLGVFTVPFGLVIGLGLAVLAHQRLRGITIFRTIFSSTIATSVAIASLIWLQILSARGLANWVVDRFGGNPVVWANDPTWALPALAAVTIWANIGISFVLMTAGLQSVPDELEESARVDGAGPWFRFRHVTLPLLGPTLLFATVVLTLNAFQSLAQVDLITNGGPQQKTQTVVYLIVDTLRSRNDAGLASAQSVLLFVLLAVFTLGQLLFLERRVHYGGRS
jgi:sn-glycerol 3-phosphate transport system permease protein